tara:strand:+ start:376 stop:543 length:168 start_codon:yes stop_codon:yes gene_type:complete
MKKFKIKIGIVKPQVLFSILGLTTIGIISLTMGIETIATGCVAGMIAISKDLLSE